MNRQQESISKESDQLPVVQLGYKNVLKTAQDLAEVGWKRIQVAQVYASNTMSGRSGLLDSGLDRAACRTPAHDQEIPLGITVDGGWAAYGYV